MKTINIKTIRIDGGTQSRVELNQETVAEYAQAFTDGAEFPPVVVFFDGASYWLADGFHRYFGALDAGESAIDAEIRTGTQRDAVLYSWGANDKHGLPRSNADKRNIVTAILKDEQGRQWSDNKIAKDFGFSHPFVGNVRRSLETVSSEKSAERTYTTKHGTTAVMKTDKIGKPSAIPKLTPEQLDRSVARIAADSNREIRQQIAELKSELTDEDGAPDEAEAEALRIQEEAEAKTMQFLLASDEPLADLASKNTQLEAQIKQLELRIAGLQNSNNEYIKRIKSLQNQLKKVQA